MLQKLLVISCWSLWCTHSFGQVYVNASDQLTNSGTFGQTMDVQAADLDGDGDLDLVLANEFQANSLLFNNGEGVFTNGSNQLPAIIHDSEDVAIADYDNDGDLDLIFCSEDDVTLGGINVHEYYLNDGAGNFTNNTNFSFEDSEANAVITIDINGDDLPDVLFGNDGQNQIYINTGAGNFANETSTRLPVHDDTTQDLNFADVDNDGDLDLFVGNEDENRLLINNGSGNFTDESETRLPQGLNIETRKVSFADVNGDNTLDIFLSNVMFIPGKDRQNRLFINDGNGVFTDMTTTNLPMDGDDTLDGVFVDVDEDGDQDLIIANVNLQTQATQKVYLNNGSGIFSDETIEVFGELLGGNALSVINADLNGDGLPDIYYGDRNTNNGNKDVLLLKNETNTVGEVRGMEKLNFTIIPNPIVADNCIIEVNPTLSGKWQLELLDTSGQVLEQLSVEKLNENQFLVSLAKASLPSGVYYFRLKKDKRSQLKKILIP